MSNCSAIMSNLNAVPEGLEDHVHPKITLPDSLHLLIMICTVDNRIFKVFANLHWGTFFSKCPILLDRLQFVADF